MSLYYNNSPYGSKLVVLSYVDDCICWYTPKEIGKWFVDTLGKIFILNFLGFSHWFMYSRISQLKEHCISLDKARYAISDVKKDLEIVIITKKSKFH